MKDILTIALADTQVAEILQAFIDGALSTEELTTWAVLAIDAKEQSHFLTYSQAVEDLLLSIEMAEEHNPFTPGQARDALATMQKHTPPLGSVPPSSSQQK